MIGKLFAKKQWISRMGVIRNRVYLVDGEKLPVYSMTEELLLQDVEKSKFHSCFSNVYNSVDGNAGFDDVTTDFPNRLVGNFAVKIGSKRLWTPMLIDTGSPRTYISEITMNKFGIFSTQDFKLTVGHHVVTGKMSEPNTTFSDLNLLGMDVLQKIFSHWPDSLGEQFRKELSLTEKDMKELDEFASLPNDAPISTVIEMIGGVIGPKYTDKIKSEHMNVLEQLFIFNVAALRDFKADRFKLIPVPDMIMSYLERVRLK